MNLSLKRTFLPSLMAASLAGVTLVPAKPAVADDLLRDVGIGAAAGVVSGAVRGRGSVINNAVRGGAAGAAVNAVNGTRSRPNRQKRSLGQDVAVGAAASAAAGALTGRGGDTLGNAVDGAVAGAAINILTKKK
ncbi:hypothetical protein [Fortiea contorta]|uniref:hypothetical protein n=1 Tax=Fortiea contorta TaxID=1892405 RepID=UPI00034AA955|nr:hypothetical protein [Fortiea contorta]